MCLAVKLKKTTRLRAGGIRLSGERTVERGTTRGRAAAKAATAAPMAASRRACAGEESAKSAKRPKPDSAGKNRSAQRLSGKRAHKAHGRNRARQANADMGPSSEAAAAGSKNASCT